MTGALSEVLKISSSCTMKGPVNRCGGRQGKCTLSLLEPHNCVEMASLQKSHTVFITCAHRCSSFDLDSA